MKIMISHGSGGVGSAELVTADFFRDRGFDVIVNDYFTQYGINMLRWHENSPDDYETSFVEMFETIAIPNEPIYHIGFSLGGFFGLINHEKFVKNYLFYPGVLGFTENMLQVDYSNAWVISGTEDKGQEKYDAFKEQCIKPPLVHYYLPNTYHAFMNTDLERSFDMVRYNIVGKCMSEEEFRNVKPNHEYMSETYGHTNQQTVLRSNEEMRWQYLNLIYEDIKNVIHT
tara:strand:- start:2240 stop:2923 length:684 start_codon:yes stop_codon:yes gene_type:complete